MWLYSLFIIPYKRSKQGELYHQVLYFEQTLAGDSSFDQVSPNDVARLSCC